MDQSANGKVVSVEEWNQLLRTYPFRQENINQLIANYFVRAGYKEAAEKFTQESNVHPTDGLRSLDARVQILRSIREGNGLDALCWVEKFFPGLLDEDHCLKFQLLQLHVIELIRTGCIEEALGFAQTLPIVMRTQPPEMFTEIERTMTLLIFENPAASPYGALLKQSHRDKVGHAVNEAILKRTSERPGAQLDHLFKMMLWCQDELRKQKIRFITMKDIATAKLELEKHEDELLAQTRMN